MPFYLYGTGRDDMHISHMLLKAPNISLAASNITFQPDLGQEVVSGLEKGLILTFSTRHEASMQPFPSENKSLPESFFFHKGAEFDVKVWKDPMVSKDSNKGPIKGPGLLKGLKKGNELYDGKVKLGDYIAVDAEGPNADPFEYKQNDSTTWHDGLEEIGKMLNGTYLPENQ